MAQEKVASPLTPKNTLLLVIKVGCNQWSAIPSRSVHFFKCQSSEFHLGILNCCNLSIPKPPEIGWSLNHEAKAFTLEFRTKFHPQKDLASAPVVFFCMVLSQALLSPFRGRLHRVLSYHLPPVTGLSTQRTLPSDGFCINALQLSHKAWTSAAAKAKLLSGPGLELSSPWWWKIRKEIHRGFALLFCEK